MENTEVKMTWDVFRRNQNPMPSRIVLMLAIACIKGVIEKHWPNSIYYRKDTNFIFYKNNELKSKIIISEQPEGNDDMLILETSVPLEKDETQILIDIRQLIENL